jgi:L-ascorbate metabolism protein UlaG (beta-lactamase superfamily)
MKVKALHIGTATVLLDIGGVRLLTDPVFDEPGIRYAMGLFGLARATKCLGPSVSASQVGPLDAVLVSHDQHDDNLDKASHPLLRKAAVVLTTRVGAERLRLEPELRLDNARGLQPWDWFDLPPKDGRPALRITAVPARHGPAWSLPFVGPVIGFILEVVGQEARGALYISGDTVLFSGIEEISRRFPSISIALLHLGRAGFPILFNLPLTMDGAQAVEAARLLKARTIVPIHYDGWTHFKEKKNELQRAFMNSGFSGRVRWLPRGKWTQL